MATARDGQRPDGAATVAVRGESGGTAEQPILTAGSALAVLRLTGGQLLLYTVLLILLIVTFIPIVYLVALSLKDNGQIYGRFWSMPDPYRWENFALGSLAIWAGGAELDPYLRKFDGGDRRARQPQRLCLRPPPLSRQGADLYGNPRPADDPADSDAHSGIRPHP